MKSRRNVNTEQVQRIEDVLKPYYPKAPMVIKDFIKEIGEKFKNRSEKEMKGFLEIAKEHSDDFIEYSLKGIMGKGKFQILKWVQDQGIHIPSQYTPRIIKVFSHLLGSHRAKEQKFFKDSEKDLKIFFKDLEPKKEAEALMRTITRQIHPNGFQSSTIDVSYENTGTIRALARNHYRADVQEHRNFETQSLDMKNKNHKSEREGSIRRVSNTINNRFFGDLRTESAHEMGRNNEGLDRVKKTKYVKKDWSQEI